ncbi:unnamed protein product, partial [Mesorhabditis spiculigera]
MPRRVLSFAKTQSPNGDRFLSVFDIDDKEDIDCYYTTNLSLAPGEWYYLDAEPNGRNICSVDENNIRAIPAEEIRDLPRLEFQDDRFTVWAPVVFSRDVAHESKARAIAFSNELGRVYSPEYHYELADDCPYRANAQIAAKYEVKWQFYEYLNAKEMIDGQEKYVEVAKKLMTASAKCYPPGFLVRTAANPWAIRENRSRRREEYANHMRNGVGPSRFNETDVMQPVRFVPWEKMTHDEASDHLRENLEMLVIEHDPVHEQFYAWHRHTRFVALPHRNEEGLDMPTVKTVNVGDWFSGTVKHAKKGSKYAKTNGLYVFKVIRRVAPPVTTRVYQSDYVEVEIALRITYDVEIKREIHQDGRLIESVPIRHNDLGYVAFPREEFEKYKGKRVRCIAHSLTIGSRGLGQARMARCAFEVTKILGEMAEGEKMEVEEVLHEVPAPRNSDSEDDEEFDEDEESDDEDDDEVEALTRDGRRPGFASPPSLPEKPWAPEPDFGPPGLSKPYESMPHFEPRHSSTPRERSPSPGPSRNPIPR